MSHRLTHFINDDGICPWNIEQKWAFCLRFHNSPIFNKDFNQSHNVCGMSWTCLKGTFVKATIFSQTCDQSLMTKLEPQHCLYQTSNIHNSLQNKILVIRATQKTCTFKIHNMPHICKNLYIRVVKSLTYVARLDAADIAFGIWKPFGLSFTCRTEAW